MASGDRIEVDGAELDSAGGDEVNLSATFSSPAELLGWMQLAQRLCEARLDKLNMQREMELKPILEAELKARRFCLDNRHRAEEFQGVTKVWWHYMLAKAWLEVWWDHKQITEEEFRARAIALRKKRDVELRRASWHWLPTRKKVSA